MRIPRGRLSGENAAPGFVELLAAHTGTATSCLVELESTSGSIPRCIPVMPVQLRKGQSVCAGSGIPKWPVDGAFQRQNLTTFLARHRATENFSCGLDRPRPGE